MKEREDTFKNTFPIVLCLYIIFTVIDYVTLFKGGFHIGTIASRSIGSTISTYIVLPVAVIALSFLSGIVEKKSQKIAVIVTTALYLIIDFYPVFCCVQRIFE